MCSSSIHAPVLKVRRRLKTPSVHELLQPAEHCTYHRHLALEYLENPDRRKSWPLLLDKHQNYHGDPDDPHLNSK